MDETPPQSSFLDMIQSDLFTFYIGEERKAFVVHSSAVAATSGPFRALVNGDLVEAKERSAALRDVDPDTFVRFLEYAYRRDYSTPSWNQEDSPRLENKPQVADNTPKITSLGLNKRKISFAPIAQGIASLRSKFRLRSYIADAIPDPNTNGPKLPADQDYTPILLAHVRLYMFADMHLIYPLKNLVLHKLQQALLYMQTFFQAYEKRVGDIVHLARYAYDHGPDRSAKGVVNELRELVVEFMASEVEAIGKHDGFKVLLEEGGEFVTDFWMVVSRYLLEK